MVESPIVVLGNGPSMRDFDFSKLDSIDTIGCNAAYRFWDRIGWYPTYYCCLDNQLTITHHEHIRRLLIDGLVKKIFIRKSFFQYYPELETDERVFCFEKIRNSEFFRSTRKDHVTTGAYAIRFAMHLGYREINLLGIDCSYQLLPEAKKVDHIKLKMEKTPDSNPNYFFDDYQRAGDRFNLPNPKPDLHYVVFLILRQDIKKFKFPVTIYNCNKKSRLFENKVFPYKDIDDTDLLRDKTRVHQSEINN